MATNQIFNRFAIPQGPSPLARNPLVQQLIGPAIKAQNRYSDPYALAAAIGSLGKGYDQMNKSLSEAAHTQRDVSMQDAYQAAGYYPAKAANEMALLQNQTDFTNRLHSGRNDVEAAFQAALAKLGPQLIGTPEFELEMMTHLTTLPGAESHGGKFDTARKKLQAQAVERQALKDGLERTLAKQYAQDYYNQNVSSLNAAPGDQEAMRRDLVKEAYAHGTQQAKSAGIEPYLDPMTQTWHARDAQKNEMPIPNNLAAQLIAMDNGPWASMQAVTNARNVQEAQTRAQQLAAAKIALEQAQANKTDVQTAAGGFAPRTQRAPADEYAKAVLAEKQADSRAAKALLNKARADPNPDPEKVKQLEDRAQAAEQEYFKYLHVAHRGELPAGAEPPAAGVAAGAWQGQPAVTTPLAPPATGDMGIPSDLPVPSPEFLQQTADYTAPPDTTGPPVPANLDMSKLLQDQYGF